MKRPEDRYRLDQMIDELKWAPGYRTIFSGNVTLKSKRYWRYRLRTLFRRDKAPNVRIIEEWIREQGR